jgi:hypothetical protein
VQKNAKLILGILALLVIIIAGVWWSRQGGERVEVDLIEALASAEKRCDPATCGATAQKDGAFSVKEVTINGESHRAIFAPPHARIYWTITVPRRGTLKTSFAMRPDSWEIDGNGAQFRIGTSDERAYEEYMREYINPHERNADRRWFSTTVDLSAFEGQTIKIVFNTDPGPPPNGHFQNDFAVWGEPRIVTR